ncbi:hypothetical protein NC651_020603 [Populus alba x Populus x berolinensis]|nr:hypothetical protein NC651_020603 [Populus alba x Populus x berolinensis]
MAVSPSSISRLELTISMPGFSPPPPFPSSALFLFAWPAFLTKNSSLCFLFSNMMISTWFYWSKLKQTEMECEYLKRWFGSLTEQNRRLQREVEELRALKVGPPTVMSPHSCEPLPASTLTMCPSCERVTTTGMDKGSTKTTTAAAATPTTAATLSSKVGTPALQSRQSSAAC